MADLQEGSLTFTAFEYKPSPSEGLDIGLFGDFLRQRGEADQPVATEVRYDRLVVWNDVAEKEFLSKTRDGTCIRLSESSLTHFADAVLPEEMKPTFREAISLKARSQWRNGRERHTCFDLRPTRSFQMAVIAQAPLLPSCAGDCAQRQVAHENDCGDEAIAAILAGDFLQDAAPAEAADSVPRCGDSACS